ncbi:hypothetical protein M405DRAFT_806143 [Rhizopogon salebrosus TDB-379]|nr:hypothetical protein M405DRAFT_806143 [Rhizopogon salebrosus TDB-379]
MLRVRDMLSSWTLVSAGANLGGADNEAGYVGLAVHNAVRIGNIEAVVEIWRRRTRRDT